MVLKLKKRPAPEAEFLDPQAEIKQLIDEIGAAQPEVDKVAAKIKALAVTTKAQEERIKRLGELMDAVQSDPDEALAIEGTRFKATAGKRSKERSYLPNGIEKVRDFLGESQFMEVAEIPLKKIDDYLTKPQRDEVTIESRGKRSKAKIEPVAA